MSKEIIQKKLDQIGVVIRELQRLLEKSKEEFLKDTVVIRAAERNFQLIVDTSSDILVRTLVDMGKGTPDTYRQSFLQAGKARIIPFPLARKLAESAELRNILVHEYDFEEDYEKFYVSAKSFLPVYRTFMGQMIRRIKK